MSIVQIPIPDLPAFEMDVVLDNRPYKLAMYWNVRGSFWTMSFFDRSREPLIMGIKLVPFYRLTTQYIARDIPHGMFIVYDSNIDTNRDRIKYDDFTGDRKLVLAYMSEDEYNAL